MFIWGKELSGASEHRRDFGARGGPPEINVTKA